MIYEITREVRAALQSKGCPYPVEYGPERAPASVAATRIVIERDRRATDTFAPPMSPKPNPIRFGVRWQAVQIWVYAQSTLEGPGVHDHERIAEQIVDKLTIALTRCVAVRRNQLAIDSAHYVSPEELELLGIEAWPGVVYQISCKISRSVDDTNWIGEKSPEAAIGGDHGVRFDLDLDATATTQGGALPSVKVDL